MRDLHDVAAVLAAQPGTKQQTFIGRHPDGHSHDLTAGFSAGAGASAGGIGFCEEVAPTLKGSAGGNCMPSVLCLNGQRCGSLTETSQPQSDKHRPSRQARHGSVMETSEDAAGTLRAQTHGHPPLVFDNHGQSAQFDGPVEKAQAVTAAYGMGGNNQSLVLFENHGIDSRYTGPHKVAPTMSARYGTGGNNQPLVAQEAQTFRFSGNIVERKPQNSGNGFGYQEDISYTLNTSDRHAVFSRQRVDQFREDDVVSTQSARQHKDATDLVCSPNCATSRFIRRLTPLECERLQGFPDGWTLTGNASDAARYKALGNSVAIPCVAYVLRGIALAAEKENQEGKDNAV